MYKIIVSCYYWPAVEGRLRLRSLQIRTNRRKLGNGLDYSQVTRLTGVENTTESNERRHTHRFKAACEAELTATLTLLDTDAHSHGEALVFLGRTKDLSASGLSLVLPSTPIDERYCGESATPLQLSLHLPAGPVNLEVSPVRCEPLNNEDTALGYLIGAQILSIDDNRDEYDKYLKAILNQANR